VRYRATRPPILLDRPPPNRRSPRSAIRWTRPQPARAVPRLCRDHGRLGNSLSTGQPVTEELLTRLPASIELTVLALLLSVGIAVPLGVTAAQQPNSWIDHLCRIVSTARVSLPTFFTGLLLVYVFYYLLGWAPAPLGRLDLVYSPPPARTGFYLVDSLLAGDGGTALAALRQIALPALTLAIFTLAPIALGMVFSFLLGANALVEKVFAWPGIGSYAIEALIASDYAPVQGFVLAMALVDILLNLLIDILYGCLARSRNARAGRARRTRHGVLAESSVVSC
jgi:ABC-type dipeptide/oligopeptide/nickel transport system permease component